jgi:hypothetical protein
MVDPWPPYVYDRNIPYNGWVINNAIDRYKTDTVIPPPSLTATLGR